tara:strand:- start:4494 stop:6200 length:1707 start_codon:yes stop_codon:yes gene_type:complete
MALDRYNRSAKLVNVPNITDVGSRQALQASQSLEQRLTNISEFAFGKLEDRALQEGQLYGVKNAPTIEQITRAVQQDQDVNELFAEEGSVFGNSARKVQAEMFRQDSLAEFLNQATIAKKGIEGKVIGLEEADNIATALQANVDATFDILKEIDPQSAVKFNAQASKIGYEVVSAAKLQAAKVDRERQQAESKLFASNYISAFTATLFDEKGDYVKTAVMTKDLRNDVISRNSQLGDVDANLELWKSENKAITSFIVADIAENNTVMQFMNGTDTKFDPLLKARGLEGNKEAIVKLVLAKEKQMNELVEGLDKQNKRANREAANTNEIDFFGDNTAKKTPDQFIKDQMKLGVFYSLAQKQKIFKQPSEGEASFTQEEAFQNTLDQITLGRVGVSKIEALYADNEINGKQYSELRKAYRNQDNYKIGYDIIKRKMGVVGNDLNIKEEIKAPLGKALATFAEKVRELEAQGLPVDQVTLANELINGELKDLYKANYEREKKRFDGLTTRMIKNNLPNDNKYKDITADDILTMSNAELDLVIAEVKKESPTTSFKNYKDKLLNLKVLDNDN